MLMILKDHPLFDAQFESDRADGEGVLVVEDRFLDAIAVMVGAVFGAEVGQADHIVLNDQFTMLITDVGHSNTHMASRLSADCDAISDTEWPLFTLRGFHHQPDSHESPTIRG